MSSSALNNTCYAIVSETCLVVVLPERLTLLESNSLQKLLNDKIQTNQKIILDFKNTQFIDGSGIGALMNVHLAATRGGCRLIFQQVPSQVTKALDISGLADISQFSSSPHFVSQDTLVTHPSVNCSLKRLLDVVGAIVGLTITGIIFLPIAVAIKIDTPGPIFFRQTRCGWLGRRFYIWKFRSMCAEAETIKNNIPNQAEGAFFKNDLDPRVTKVGRFLRRTSLDELPQFWSVLKGDMSLVGTRPPVPEEVDKYQVFEWQRLNVKPGMTGEWQANGRSNVRKFEDVVKLDLDYQEKWSIKYDILLIIRTIKIIFRKNNGAI